MQNFGFIRARALIGVALMLLTPLSTADTLNGRVVAVADGDTLSLLVGRQQYTIRIAGIDAPERHQVWGDRSKTNLSRLSMNQMAVAECARAEQQGQKICKLTVKAVDIGLEQIQAGMAWWYWELARELKPEVQSAYQGAELMAKLRRQGLWRETNPVPPWEFKRENRVFPESVYPRY
jgi:endonuclease YncB( thermonuclease family)